jgi:iron(III) transport system substrate-binding protein
MLMVGVLAACGGGDGDDDGGGAAGSSDCSGSLEDAAAEDGEVTIYSSQGLDQLNDLADRFEKKYPDVSVEVVRGTDTDLSPRVEAEHQTGKGSADIFVTASQGWVEGYADQGWFVEPTGPNFESSGYDADTYVHEGGPFEVSAAILTFGWNTEQFPDGIDDYPDLLDPELKGGKIGVPEPGAQSFVDFYLYLEENYGEDFVEDLAAQEPRIYPSSLPMAEALSSGELAAATFVQVLVDEKEAGAPVDSGLAEQAWGARFFGLILETAPNPCAAQLLADFLITTEGQEAIARKAASVLPDIEGAVATVDQVREQDLDVLTPEFVAEYQQKWNELFR